MKTVYVPMVADYLHHGHIHVINIAKSLGLVTVGLMTDSAAASYKRVPLLNYESRFKLVSAIDGVHQIQPQNQLDYVEAIEKFRPDYFVHGTDWRSGVQKFARERVIDALFKYGGELIEPEYTLDASSSTVVNHILSLGVQPHHRLSSLTRLLRAKSFIRGIESHNGLTAMIAESSIYEGDTETRTYDFIWLSSLTDSASRGKPDIELVDISARLQTLQDILDVTTKPIIFDADTGGKLEHFPYLVSTLGRLGVSACIIEDKTGLKKNSLFGTQVTQSLDDPELFAQKIIAGKRSAISDDFMIIARIESLIAGFPISEALHRASVYAAAGADGIMIHSRHKSGDEIIQFCQEYRQLGLDLPLILVPSSYNHIKEEDLRLMGCNVVIYANHMLRSAYPAMRDTALSILEHQRSLECDESIMSINEIINLIPER